MPWIEHCSKKDIIVGEHQLYGDNCILIQIADVCGHFPKPRYGFSDDLTFQFEFMDDWEVSDKVPEEALIGNDQAQEIVRILRKAIHMDYNVVVHCVGGVSRSFAVSEVAKQMGFHRMEKYGCPNLLVKHKLQEAAGFPVDWDEQPYFKFQTEQE